MASRIFILQNVEIDLKSSRDDRLQISADDGYGTKVIYTKG